MSSPRVVATGLSGYLCGTHSGVLSALRVVRRSPAGTTQAAVLGAAHRALSPVPRGSVLEIDGDVWKASPEVQALATALRWLSEFPGVVDVVLFGSQARGTTTGFSDVDVLLVVEDEVAEREEALRALRPHVIAAQRRVLAHQPMQHHGFEVATPKLLLAADAALCMPAAALSEAKRVRGGAPLILRFGSPGFDRANAFRALGATLAHVRGWPVHPWELHRVVSMFELLPTLYLQSRGADIPKSQSFTEARPEFGASWWPYDVLNEARERWPRRRYLPLEFAIAAARNPWAAVALWRRLPAAIPESVVPLITGECLQGLRALAQAMERRMQ